MSEAEPEEQEEWGEVLERQSGPDSQPFDRDEVGDVDEGEAGDAEDGELGDLPALDPKAGGADDDDGEDDQEECADGAQLGEAHRREPVLEQEEGEARVQREHRHRRDDQRVAERGSSCQLALHGRRSVGSRPCSS